MNTMKRILSWITTIYGAAASIYFLAWYFSAIRNMGSSEIGVLHWGAGAYVLFFVHAFAFCFAIETSPKRWVPIGPVNDRFQVLSEASVGISVAMFTLSIPLFIKHRGGYADTLLSSILLIQSTYIFAHFASGLVIFGNRTLQNEKISTVLAVARGANLSRTCQEHGISDEVYRRWQKEVERSKIGESIFTPRA